jgi:hypothetical protein
MPKIHFDTDVGGDIDDVCAFAMLLKWPDLPGNSELANFPLCNFYLLPDDSSKHT